MSTTHPSTALVPYLRGELSAEERERVARHLEACVECRASADSFAAVIEELAHRLEQMPAPDWATYRAELRRKLAAREQAPRRWWQPGLAWASLATVGAAAAALTLVLAMHPPRVGAPTVDQLAMGNEIASADLGLLRYYPVVERLDLLENYDVIEHLDELPPADRQKDEIRS